LSSQITGTNDCTARYHTLGGDSSHEAASPSPTPSSEYDEIVHNNGQMQHQQQINGNNLNFRVDNLGGCAAMNGANNFKNLKAKRNNLSSTLSAAHNKNAAISQQKVLVHHHVSDFPHISPSFLVT
jgi:hypothetical protein